MRTCVGCGKKALRGELVRLVVGPRGADGRDTLSAALPFAPGARPAGRGAHVHPRPSCLAQASKKGLPRSLRREVKLGPGAIEDALRRALEATLQFAFRAARRLPPKPPAEEGSTSPFLSSESRRHPEAPVGQPGAMRVALGHPRLAALVAQASALAGATGVKLQEVG